MTQPEPATGLDGPPGPTPLIDPNEVKFRAERNPLKRIGKMLGPGLITGASDDDPSGIGTYAQAGAQFGFATLWTTLAHDRPMPPAWPQVDAPRHDGHVTRPLRPPHRPLHRPLRDGDLHGTPRETARGY